MNLIKFLCCVLVISTSLSAQQSVNSSGGDISSGDGNIAYSIGQITFETFGTNDGFLSEGVQQPLEIYTLGIEDELKTNFSMYPNPVDDRLNIQMYDVSDQKLTYSIFSNTGRLLKKGELSNSLNVVPLSHLSTGIYLFDISNQNKSVFTKKIIKK